MATPATSESTAQQLRSALRGEVLAPSDAGYEEARKVYNGMIDRHPRLIARCAGVADVMACIRFARDNGIQVSIRGGGHNAAGLGVWDDALVVDLSRMRSVRVDPEARTARVEGGCVWGDVDHATHAFGMATPSGVISSTGVGGLTLGGGLGHLSRKYGLSIDNLLEADLVLADGSFVTASPRAHEDLFWAIRGGGGNFGVVTSFLFRLHPVKDVYAGPMFWPLDKSREVLEFYREFIASAPEDITGFFAFLVVPPAPPFPEALYNKKVCGIVWCYTGPEKGAEKALAPVRKISAPAFEMVGWMPHPTLQSMFDALYASGLQWYWKADFVKELSDQAIKLHIEHGSKMPTTLSTMHMYPINGAVHRVGKNDTAFTYRDATWAMVIVGVDPDPANREKITAWPRNYWEALHPYSAGGAYVNFMMDEGQEGVQATYLDNYKRLAKVKKKYDPKNFFRVNQNIKPAK
jgi:FAD/FMN-containing dehydrogenase